MEQDHTTKYFDERDSMFTRVRLIKGSPAYREYYRRYPERREADNDLRECGGLMRLATAGGFNGSQIQELMPRWPNRFVEALMHICPPLRHSVTSKMKEQVSHIPDHLPDEERILALIDDSSPAVAACFEADRRKKPATKKVNVPPERMTSLVKEVASFYGASLAGIVELQDCHYYTHRNTGEPIHHGFKYAIVFAVEMPTEMINRAPHRETLLATCNGYVQAAQIGARLSGYIKSIGYDTSLSCMVSYDAPLVLLAERAGIGQIGRCNVIVTKEYGNRVRLGAVMTNLPLVADQPVDFGLKQFCMLCGKCAANCPVRALSSTEPQLVNGSLVWEHNEVKCMRMWTKTSTDCAICISSCPFTQGVDPEKTDAMKGNPAVMRDILREHTEKYGSRAYNPQPLPIAAVLK
ncbi:MAG: hypothetical protein JW846_07215 [Dehalococcoidia bacterium]|nr:hypothetical protein [Dehalococcoidia bacterium]